MIGTRAVWSFWTKPYNARQHEAWPSEKHHLLSWVLSTMTARKHYATTALCTDDAGARLLVDGIGLEFDHISTALNLLDAQDPDWWALGKLHAYRMQAEPFVHIDSDVFLWQPLSPDPASVSVLAQNPEYLLMGHFHYQPEAFEAAITAGSGWLPREWRWYRANCAAPRGECCGVFGGSQVDFIRHYADQAIRMMGEPKNRAVWRGVRGKGGHNLLFEQYLLAACIEYHRHHARSRYRKVAISYVFPSVEEAFNPAIAERVGYTHLLFDAKRNPRLADRLETRVARDYPTYYHRCIEYLRMRKKPA
jgi:hypothetical protein